MWTISSHPWNADPLPLPRYRLTVAHQRKPNTEIVAESVSRDALMGLAEQFRELHYDFVRLERLVPKDGIEPPTHGFSARCSTD